MSTIQQVNKRLNKLSGDMFGVSNSLIGGLEKKILSEYAKVYIEIEKTITRMFKRFDELTPGEMAKYHRWNRLRAELLDASVTLFGSTNRIIASSTAQNMDLGYYSNGYMFESTLGVNLGFQKINTNAIIANASQDFGFINWRDNNRINIARYNKNVESTINRGIIQGHGIAKMSRELKKETVKASRGAKRILRTESHRAYEAGNMVGLSKVADAGKLQGISVLKFWIATFDERTRGDHGVADGQERPVDKDFFVGGVNMSAPGLSGDPAQDIHCRCTTGTKIKNIMPGIRREQLTRSSISYMTFTDWATSRNLPKVA